MEIIIPGIAKNGKGYIKYYESRIGFNLNVAKNASACSTYEFINK